MVSDRQTILAGFPDSIIESFGMPGNPFCADGDYGFEIPRAYTQSEIFHSKLDKASTLIKKFSGRGDIIEIDSAVSKIISKNGTKIASRFFKPGINSADSLLRYAKFLFLSNNNLECFAVVEGVISSLEKFNKRAAA